MTLAAAETLLSGLATTLRSRSFSAARPDKGRKKVVP
jgi:hypothetical protein